MSVTSATGEERPAPHGVMTNRRTRLLAAWPLVVVLGLAAFTGFWRLAERGSVFVDEGYQTLESHWVDAKLGYLAGHFPGSFDQQRFVLDDGEGVPLTYGKPLHALLGAVAVRLLPGSGPTPILVLQGLLGLGTVALVYAIGRRIAGPIAGVLSAAVLAGSVSFLVYRRSGLSESDSTFFFALAVFALLAWSDRGALTARRAAVIGILAGLCFTANDRWYIALPLIGAMMLIVDSRHPRSNRIRSSTLNVISLTGGFLIVPVMFEAASVAFLWMAHNSDVSLPYETYFQQLHRRYRAVVQGHGAGPRPSQIMHTPYLRYLAGFDGRVWLAGVSAAIGLLVILRRRVYLIPVLWALAPFLVASASPLTAPRYITLTFAGAALALGVAGAHTWQRSRVLSRMFAVGVTGAVLASSLLHTPGAFTVQAGWTRPLQVVEGGGEGLVLSPKSYPVAAHAGLRRTVLGFTDTFEWAREQQEAGARWLLLEVWVPRGTRPRDARPPRAFTALGPIGELSSHFLRSVEPAYARRWPPHAFVYEGFPPGRDRLVLLYDLSFLPPAPAG